MSHRPEETLDPTDWSAPRAVAHRAVDDLQAVGALCRREGLCFHVDGCIGALVRDARLHYNAFALHPEYLEEQPRGVAGAEYPFDYGIELSRGFKALKGSWSGWR